MLLVIISDITPHFLQKETRRNCQKIVCANSQTDIFLQYLHRNANVMRLCDCVLICTTYAQLEPKIFIRVTKHSKGKNPCSSQNKSST